MTVDQRGQENGAVGRDSAVITLCILASRVTGLGKFIVIGAVLGPTFFGNLFQSVNLIPNLVLQFLTGALFTSPLVPRLFQAQARGGPTEAGRVAGGFVGVVLLGFLGVALLVVLAGPLMLIIGALGLGIDDPAIAAEQRRVGVLLLALVMPQLLLYGVAGAGGSAMNSQGRFAIAAAAPVVENVGIIAALLAAGFIWGRGLELGAVTNEHIVFVGLGSTAAVVLHAAVQCWGAHRVGLSLRPRWGWREPVIRGILRAARPSLGFSVMNAARMFTTLVAANAVAGGAVAYNLALAFYFLVAALIARPVSTALLPVLVRLRESGDMQGVRDRLTAATRGLSSSGCPRRWAWLPCPCRWPTPSRSATCPSLAPSPWWPLAWPACRSGPSPRRSSSSARLPVTPSVSLAPPSGNSVALRRHRRWRSGSRIAGRRPGGPAVLANLGAVRGTSWRRSTSAAVCCAGSNRAAQR